MHEYKIGFLSIFGKEMALLWPSKPNIPIFYTPKTISRKSLDWKINKFCDIWGILRNENFKSFQFLANLKALDCFERSWYFWKPFENERLLTCLSTSVHFELPEPF